MNADECVITRIQEMSLNYHFKIEQEAGSSTFAFFGFNGNNLIFNGIIVQNLHVL